jgi:hypothetical protein
MINERATEIVEKSSQDQKITLDSKDQSTPISEAAVPEVQERAKDEKGKENL